MKRILSFFLVLCVIMSLIVIPAVASEFYKEGDYGYTVENEEAIITHYYGIGGDITIPSVLGGYPVTAIGMESFSYCYSLTNIAFPGSLKKIGDFAFYNCNNLTDVVIPDGVISIASEAFSWCTSLERITIGSGVENIASSVFYACWSLKNIEVSNNNPYYSSFDGNLFNKDKTTLVQYAIGKEDTHYTIPDSVTTIASSAFVTCQNITNVTMNNSLTTIGDYAFAEVNLMEIIIPDSVTSIGAGAFARCQKLTNIAVSSNNTCFSSLDGNLFNKDHTILMQYTAGKEDKHYTIPDSVTIICDGAFWCCFNLMSVDLPENLINIGNSSFRVCRGLTSITIPDNVETIGEFAFSRCDSLTNITIYGNVKTISYNTFSYCYSLTNITLPDSVEIIGDGAFNGCDSLTRITLPDKVKTIGKQAFQSCDNLTSITIPGSVKTISHYAFSGCGKLADIYYGGHNITWKGIDIWDGHESLSNATIHYTPIYIEKAAYSDNSVVVKVTLAGESQELGHNVIVALYEGNMLVDIYTEVISAIIDGEEYIVDDIIFDNIPEAKTEYIVKVFCWSGLTTLTPLYEAVTKTVE